MVVAAEADADLAQFLKTGEEADSRGEDVPYFVN